MPNILPIVILWGVFALVAGPDNIAYVAWLTAAAMSCVTGILCMETVCESLCGCAWMRWKGDK